MLLHDIQEAISGDYDHNKKKEIGLKKVKFLERKSIKSILSLFPKEIEEFYFSLWKEFESHKTLESVLARDIDKIEMVLQALEYEQEGCNPMDFEPFWKSARLEIETPFVRNLLESLKKMRLLNNY